MIKAIMGEIDTSTVLSNQEEKCHLGRNVKIGYFAQNQASLLDEA